VADEFSAGEALWLGVARDSLRAHPTLPPTRLPGRVAEKWDRFRVCRDTVPIGFFTESN